MVPPVTRITGFRVAPSEVGVDDTPRVLEKPMEQDMIALSSPRNALSLARFGCGYAATTAIAFVKRTAQALRHRREMMILASVNDHMLADIGLTRGDVNDAFAEPVWRDPTAVLAARVHERRSPRRGVWPPRPRLIASSPSILPPEDAVEDDAGAEGMRPKRANAA